MADRRDRFRHSTPEYPLPRAERQTLPPNASGASPKVSQNPRSFVLRSIDPPPHSLDTSGATENCGVNAILRLNRALDSATIATYGARHQSGWRTQRAVTRRSGFAANKSGRLPEGLVTGGPRAIRCDRCNGYFDRKTRFGGLRGSVTRAFGGPALRWAAAAAMFLCLSLPIWAATGDYRKQPDGIVLQTAEGTLRVQVVAENIVRVTFAKSAILFSRNASAVLPYTPAVKWSLTDAGGELAMTTARLRVRVVRNTGCVSFFDAAAGRPILAESPGGHVVESAEVQGERTFHARQLWQANADESLYGLGQQQKGTLDIKGYDLELWQHNTNVVVPFLLSSRGYGIFWDNMSYSRFGDLRPFEPIPAENLLNAEGRPGGLTMAPLDGSAPPVTVSAIEVGRGRGGTAPPEGAPAGGRGARPRDTRWEGSVLAPVTGDYQFKTYSNGGIKVWLDNRLVIDHYRQGWLTDDDQVKVHLEANRRYALKVEWTAEEGSTLRLTWKTPSAEAGKFSLWSEVADGVDYYFVYGPKLDNVVAGYRLLTGQAPDDAAVGFRAMAIAAEVRYRPAEPGRGERIPQAQNPLRQYRAGLAILEGRRLGNAPVRPLAFSRSRWLDQSDSRPARPPDDLRLGQVLSGHRQLRRACRRPAICTSPTCRRR